MKRRGLLAFAAFALLEAHPARAGGNTDTSCDREPAVCLPPAEDGSCEEGFAYAERDGRCVPAERICKGRAWRCTRCNHPRVSYDAEHDRCECCRPLDYDPPEKWEGRCWRWDPKPYCDGGA